MRRSVWFALLVFALAITGCNQNRQSAARPARPKFYSKVISLSPSTTEIWLSNGKEMFLKGRTASDDWPDMSVKMVEVVASVKPNYERIAEIKPDLVVYDAALFKPEEIEKIKKLSNADAFAIDADNIDDYIGQLYDLASLGAFESRISGYVAKINAEREAARSDAFSPVPKVAVILAGSGGRDYIAGSKSFVASAVEAAGGKPVGPESNKFEALSPEAFLAFNPDVIIVGGTKDNLKGAQAVAANPKYQTVNAIKKGHIKVVEEDVLVRRGGRVDVLIHSLHDAMAPRGAR